MNKIYVGNLSFNTTEQELSELFSQFGKISEVALIRDRFSNQLKGFGFVTFDNKSEAQSALAMDGKEFLGRPLRVNIAQERTEGGSRGGRSGGGRSGSGRSGGGDRGDRGGRRW